MGDATVPATAMADDARYSVVIRPRPALVRSTALSIVFSAVPLAVALVWVSFPMRLWAVVATLVVVVGVLVGILFARLRSAFVGLTEERITVRGVLMPSRSVDVAAVDAVVLATTFGGSVDRTTRELIALGATGQHLFRMRADVWGDDALDLVVDGLGGQVTELGRPLSAREFARRYPAGRRRHR